MIRCLLLCCCLMLIQAVAADQQSSGAAMKPLGQLETRELRIALFLGPEEPLYTIARVEGEVLVELATANEIAELDLDLYRLVESLVANLHGRGASFVDGQSAKQ